MLCYPDGDATGGLSKILLPPRSLSGVFEFRRFGTVHEGARRISHRAPLRYLQVRKIHQHNGRPDIPVGPNTRDRNVPPTELGKMIRNFTRGFSDGAYLPDAGLPEGRQRRCQK